MSNPLVRAARTYVQSFVGLLVVGWVDLVSADDFLSVAKSAAIAAVPAVLSLAQNMLEDKVAVQVPKG